MKIRIDIIIIPKNTSRTEKAERPARHLPFRVNMKLVPGRRRGRQDSVSEQLARNLQGIFRKKIDLNGLRYNKYTTGSPISTFERPYGPSSQVDIGLPARIDTQAEYAIRGWFCICLHCNEGFASVVNTHIITHNRQLSCVSTL